MEAFRRDCQSLQSELRAARAALGVNDDLLVLCNGHPVVDAVIAAGGSLDSI